MKRFLLYLLFLGFIAFFILEIVLRFFNLSASTMPTANVNGDYLFQPGSSGQWVRGGLGEIKSQYKINAQGFNSLVNYDTIFPNAINVALIGDSYIQGLQTDVDKSIGRQLEEISKRKLIVHEYGRAGANIVDFGLAYQDYVMPKNYDFTFILLTNKDLESNSASFKGRGDKVASEGIFRKVYDEIAVLRYLNINHGLGVQFRELVSNFNFFETYQNKKASDENEEEVATSNNTLDLNKVNLDALDLLDRKVIILYEGEKLDTSFINNFDFNFVKIIHEKLPKDHGFDGHWNENGRYNCANAMFQYIDKSL